MGKALRFGLAGLMAASILAGAPVAFASGGGDGITRTGACSANSMWKLKASPDNGRIEVEFEVDSNVVGQTWNWKLKDNGVAFAKGSAVTQAPSGSFEVERFTANQTGSDRIVGSAANPQTGETCRGALTL